MLMREKESRNGWPAACTRAMGGNWTIAMKAFAIRVELETEPGVAIFPERVEASANRGGLSGTRVEKSDRYR